MIGRMPAARQICRANMLTPPVPEQRQLLSHLGFRSIITLQQSSGALRCPLKVIQRHPSCDPRYGDRGSLRRHSAKFLCSPQRDLPLPTTDGLAALLGASPERPRTR